MKRRPASPPPCLLGLPLLIAALSACGSHAKDGQSSSAGAGGSAATMGNDAVLADHTTVLGQSAIDSVVVSADRLVFPVSSYDDVLLGRSVGDVLVGDRQAAGSAGTNPDGFLRKVRSVMKQGGGTVVMTDPAIMQDAVKSLHFQATLQSPTLTTAGPITSSFREAPGRRLEGNGTPIKLIDFSGTKLFDIMDSVTLGNGKSIGFHALGEFPVGTVNFTPSFDIGADVGSLGSAVSGAIGSALGGGLGDAASAISFHATATGEISAELQFHGKVDLTSNLDNDSFTKLVAQQVFKSKSSTIADFPIDLGTVSAGPLSIPVKAHFTATLACEFAFGGLVDVTVDGKASANITAGAKYENSTLTPVVSFDKNLDLTGPTWTLGGVDHVKCTIKPDFNLQFFGVGFVEIWASGFVNLDGSLKCGPPDSSGNPTGTIHGDASAGASAGAHAKADVFGVINYDKQCTLFSVETPVASSDTAITLPGGPKATCTDSAGASGAAGSGGSGGSASADPSQCFGGDASGSAGSGGSGGGTGATVGNCTPDPGSAVPSGWTCNPSAYGDCKCDCNCGAMDKDCADGACAGCGHDECTAGDPLGPQCSSCAAAVCKADPYCCDQQWGPSCFDSVMTECGKTCP